MKEVILSHDNEARIYLVPDEVADNLEQYCLDFATNWVWHGPEKSKLLRKIGNGKMVAIFDAPDFIDYLNKWAFPEQQSKFVRGLGIGGYEEMPEEYNDYPQFNF